MTADAATNPEGVVTVVQVAMLILGSLQILVGIILGVVIKVYIPQLVGMWAEVKMLRGEMNEVKRDVERDIPALYRALNAIEHQLAVIVDRMPKRRDDDEGRAHHGSPHRA